MASSPSSYSYDSDYFDTERKMQDAERYEKEGIESAIIQEKEQIAEEEALRAAAAAPIATTISARTTIDYVINKRKEMREGAKKVKEEITRYTTTYASNEDSWKLDSGVTFYKLLYDWLTHQAGSTIAIKNYDANKLSRVIAEFESSMANLISSESEDVNEDNYNNVKSYINLIKTWVKEVEEMYPTP